MLYCQPVFLRGTGLGNRLFPWARCRIFSNLNNIPMLSPRWSHIRSAPFRKGGINLATAHHQILLWDLFKEKEGDVVGFNKIYLEYFGKKILEPDDFKSKYELNNSQDTVVIFKGERGDTGRLKLLKGYESFLLDELHAITKTKWLNIANRYSHIPIAINVRRGKDFNDPKSPMDFYTKGTLRTPLSWFVGILQSIRKVVGYPVAASVVSDGTKEDLADLLNMENVTFVRPGSAISDLLVLSQAKILIASGGSSFSAWASFLGQMPTVTHPGQSLNWFGLGDGNGNITEFDPSHLPESFIDSIAEVGFLAVEWRDS